MSQATASSPKRLGDVACFEPPAVDDPGDAAIGAYKRDGVICLRGAFGPAWIETIESGIDKAMEKQSRSSAQVEHDGEAGFFYYDSLMWKRVEPFRRFIFDSHAPDLFWRLLETETLNFYYDFLLIKSPGCASAVTPWHQDHSYYPLNGTKIINCWTALDSIPVETALRFARGSHLWGNVYRAVHFAPDQEYENSMTDRPLAPAIDDDPGAEIVACALEPGDTLVWNSRMFHSAPGNTLDRRRAALSTNWVGDDVTYFDLPQESDPAYRGENLVDGGPITCESFPQVRPLAA